MLHAGQHDVIWTAVLVDSVTCAERTRDKAEQFSMRHSRERLLEIAEEYDRLAQRASERQVAATESV